MARLRMIGLTVGSLARTASLLAFPLAAGLPMAAFAQNGKSKAVEPYYVVVTADRASVRAGDHDSYYTVVDATKGQFLRVVAEHGTWSKVAYLTDWPAFVKTSEGSYDAPTKTFTLGQASALLAFSSMNPQHPWQSLLDENSKAASGTKLKVLGEVKDTGGNLKGYKIVAPDGAYGFVESRNLRRATKEEVDAAKAKGQIGAAPTVPAATPTPTPTPAPTTPAATPTNPPSTPAAGTPGADRTLVDPQTPVGPGSTPTPATNPPANPATTPTSPPTSNPPANPAANPTANPGTNPSAANPTTIPQGGDPNAKPAEPTKEAEPVKEPVKREPTAAERQTATLTQLDEAFRKVNAKDVDVFTAEYDQLISEIKKTISGLGTTPNDESIKKQLQLRADVLKLRVDFRESMKIAEEARRKLNENIVKTSKVVAEAEKSKVYTMVGTLSASEVYDGKNLPKMYRVVSADTGAPVTLGYLKPDAAMGIDAKVGQVVGVIGEAAVDPTLKLNIITPVRVDLIGQAGDSSLPQIPAAPAPAAKPEEKPAIPAPKPKNDAPAKPSEIIK